MIKIRCFGSQMCRITLSSGKFLNYGKSAGVNFLTNIMSDFDLPCRDVGGSLQRMFGPLITVEVPSLSMTDGRACFAALPR